LTIDRGSRLVQVVLNNALWAQAGGSLIFGGTTLFLAYVGTPRMKTAVCGAAIAAIWLIHKRWVSPFRTLLGYRPSVHLVNPALSPLRKALETQKARWLFRAGLGWLAVVSASIAAGTLYPPKLTAILAAGEPIRQLAAWPLLQSAAEWVLIAIIAGFLAFVGSACVLWFAIYLLTLARHPRL
jgi:hypothetical protein